MAYRKQRSNKFSNAEGLYQKYNRYLRTKWYHMAS